ncbi:pheST operon leader peptide PheM [Salmonella enterica]|nr:pheST operon leader peptide PheM [Klebsiella pneumoniae]EDX8506810.1 pheST operon leader peptide PheM [Salmonella enterica subsp. enterica serovar Ohio]EKO6663676.1 pheST operon leader peptide PheM [Salmonella enterica]QKN39616.1 pheST operon leader peptide PheM [Escherichia coli]EEW9727284.1 pheST operon leader peptide PheM [Salmonella enterica subsp. enterica serovar Ohio]EHC2000363.1 pheST operon leader peptide PheM [Salmonella enterica subsp. enterica serovar Ohio]
MNAAIFRFFFFFST